jgi:Ser/Thr protein kinase RdoA (MazF antagonist)
MSPLLLSVNRSIALRDVAPGVRRGHRICGDNPAVPDDDLVRSALRDQWHLLPEEITVARGGWMSRAWEVSAGPERYVVRLIETGSRQRFEAGLMAGEHLRGHGIAAGEPVRTLGGGLTVATGTGALAVLSRVPGRRLDGRDPVDQQWWGDRLGAVHRALQGFHHPGLGPWQLPDPDVRHAGAEPWLRPAVADAVAAATRLTVTDRLTYGVLHGDPAPGDFVVDTGTGRAGLLGCGAGGIGPLVYDVAAAVLYAGGTAAAGELVDGYLAAGPVTADELDAALPVLLRLRWAVRADRAARDGSPEALRAARVALESMPG